MLLGATALTLLGQSAEARVRGTAPLTISKGWNTLPLGAGGLVTGLDIAPDGTMVCRTDVGNAYRFSGKCTDYADPTKKWIPLLTYAGLGNTAIDAQNVGMWEHRIAPGNSAVHVAIFPDMAGSGTVGKLYYGTWDGAKVSWNPSNLSFANSSANSNGNLRRPYYKIAVDPANENVAYCGMPFNSGNSAGVYTSLNQSGGSTLATFNPVITSGVTTIPAVASFTYNGSTTTNVLSCGLAIDPSLGTTTIGGQTVTRHIILPVAGNGIWESTNGGASFTEIAISAVPAFSTGAFQVLTGGFNGGGVYYCIVQSSVSGAWGIWSYASGVWTNITSGTYGSFSSFVINGAFLVINPYSPNGYLSVTGPNGMGAGFTSTSANTATPSWTGLTSGEIPSLLAVSYDIPYVNDLFGQGLNAFTDASSCAVDPNGNCWWGGNQSFFYLGTSGSNPVPSGLPSYAPAYNTFWWSMGRGMEATVAQDAWVPPGGTYPILACQDLGGVLRGTFTGYPQHVFAAHNEYSGNSLESAANDPSFVVATITGQIGNSNGTVDAPAYSTNYGADGSWVSAGAGVASLYAGGLPMAGGQTVAVDHDNWVRIVQGTGGQAYQPAFTQNATAATPTWALCTGLPSANFFNQSWSNGNCFKPLAVGYGADLGAVWALLISPAGTSATIYRCPDLRVASPSFSSIITWTIAASVNGPFLMSVPGFTGELWATARFTAGSGTNYGLWHIASANTGIASKVRITLPADADLPVAFCLGCPLTPGGYPALYYVGRQSGLGNNSPKFLYQGAWNGTTVTWTRYGPTGTQQDLPPSCQLAGIQAIRASWDIPGLIFIASNQNGYAYYNP